MSNYSTEEHRILDEINSGVADTKTDLEILRNAPGTGGATLTLFTSTTVVTATTTVGPTVFVNGAKDLTVMVDMTGMSATPELHFYGGSSGFGMFQVRAETATGNQGLMFRVGTQTTGSVAGASGVTTFNDFRMDVVTSGTVTAAGVTVKAILVLPKV